MPRIALKLYLQPSFVEAYLQFKAKEGHFIAKTAFIDTGAHVSLFPIDFLNVLEHKIIDRNFSIEQAGIAGQAFQAIEAEVSLYFEDLQGNMSNVIQVRAWFANTDKMIIGFQDILDRAKLEIDYLHTRTAWIEFA